MKYVLIVDDDVNIQELLSTYLKHAGYGVILSPDGRDALKQCVIRKPDAILMDFRMPRLDGLNALDLMTLTAMGKKIPILMMSGMASAEVIETCKRLGASDFLVKPFNPDELLKKIEFYLSSGPMVQSFEKESPVAQTPQMVTANVPLGTPPTPHPAHPAQVAPPAEVIEPTPEPEVRLPSERVVEDRMPSTPAYEASGPLAELTSVDRHFAQMLLDSSNVLQKGLVLKAIEEFTQRAVSRLVDIQVAFREERFSDVVEFAQALKEESLSLGAHQFAGLSAELEELAKKQAPEGLRKIRGLREEYQRCEADFTTLRQAMESQG